MAWLLIWGREGIARDRNGAFGMAKEGVRLGCHHCQGVLAYCYMSGFGCEADHFRSLELARESSENGSRYGQHTLGDLYACGQGGLVEDAAQAISFYRFAAAQCLDGAQLQLGYHYLGIDEDFVEELRWFQLAAEQGNPEGFFWVAHAYQHGRGVAADQTEAIRWYLRAQAAGQLRAAAALMLMI